MNLKILRIQIKQLVYFYDIKCINNFSFIQRKKTVIVISLINFNMEITRNIE